MKHDYFDVSQRAGKAYSRSMEPVCQAHDLTKNELDVLLFLYNNPEYDRAVDIVVHRGMTKSHVSLSVSRLQARDLLRRIEDPEDRRAAHLRLTAEAKQIAAEGRTVQEAFFRALFRGLGQEELQTWLRIKDAISQNVAAMNAE